MLGTYTGECAAFLLMTTSCMLAFDYLIALLLRYIHYKQPQGKGLIWSWVPEGQRIVIEFPDEETMYKLD